MSHAKTALAALLIAGAALPSAWARGGRGGGGGRGGDWSESRMTVIRIESELADPEFKVIEATPVTSTKTVTALKQEQEALEQANQEAEAAWKKAQKEFDAAKTESEACFPTPRPVPKTLSVVLDKATAADATAFLEHCRKEEQDKLKYSLYTITDPWGKTHTEVLRTDAKAQKRKQAELSRLLIEATNLWLAQKKS